MTAERWFFDTNVLVYLFDAKAPEKQRLAQDLFRRAVDVVQPVVSTQVLQEFFVTVTRTTKKGLPISEARLCACGRWSSVYSQSVLQSVLELFCKRIHRSSIRQAKSFS